jgi:cyclophilin family peptidyl-prolyl cis-trans isomerase
MQIKDAGNILIIELADGEVAIELLPGVAPLHVERIKTLAREDAYDNVAFHRVIEGFVAQAGDVEYGDLADGYDPELVGSGSSDLPNLTAEFSDIPFDRGVVGMARAGDPLAQFGLPEREEFLNSANSQFFIMFEPAPFLDGNYTVFGRVAGGMNVVDGITRTDGTDGADVTPDRMLDVRIAADSGEPVAADDMIEIDQFTPAFAIDLAGNDLDQEGDGLAVVDVSPTSVAGSGVRLNADGTVDYAPRSDLVGTDSFFYTVEDAQGERTTAQVEITAAPTEPDLVAAWKIAYMYEAAYNRFPDQRGVEFWVNEYLNEVSTLEEIAGFFITETEFVELYGPSAELTDEAFVQQLYLNTLGREGEPGGVGFWTDLLANDPGFGRADALLAFAESPENQFGSPDITTLTETAAGEWDFVA